MASAALVRETWRPRVGAVGWTPLPKNDLALLLPETNLPAAQTTAEPLKRCQSSRRPTGKLASLGPLRVETPSGLFSEEKSCLPGGGSLVLPWRGGCSASTAIWGFTERLIHRPGLSCNSVPDPGVTRLLYRRCRNRRTAKGGRFVPHTVLPEAANCPGRWNGLLQVRLRCPVGGNAV